MSFEITVLGSSSALPTSKKFPSAHVVNIHERFFLIDCGEGTQIQLRKFKISFSKINHIFITHLHGDHFFGIWGVISTFNLLGRKNDLHIYSPGNLEKKVYSVINKIEIGFNIFFHRISHENKKIIYETKSIEVSAFPLDHRIETYGYFLKEKPKERNIKKEAIVKYNLGIKDILNIKQGKNFTTKEGELIKNSKLSYPPYKARSYAYCSDTKYFEETIPYIKNTDVLYHEATFAKDLQETADITKHSTSEDAGTIALKANVKKLLIGHFSTRYKDTDIILEEAKKIFPNTLAVNDGDVFSIALEREKE
ncbi:MAG: ribonuclease Z [Bacteroidales bacterium]|nr:ribonuclease Z [Bacteroidales bacterium]